MAGMLTLMDIFHRLNARPGMRRAVCLQQLRRLGNLAGCKSHYARFCAARQAFLSCWMINRRMSAPVPSVPEVPDYGGNARRPQLADFRSAQRRRGAQPPDAARCIASMCRVPQCSLTTYNVGVISGGTSVNAIAQRAGNAVCRYRSNDAQCMAMMKEKLDDGLSRKHDAGCESHA
ncbi:MAG: hypothetical protein ACLUHE_16255 [Christensenellales bacterium]